MRSGSGEEKSPPETLLLSVVVLLIMTIKITMVTQHIFYLLVNNNSSSINSNFINFISSLNADVTKFFALFSSFREVMVLNDFAEAFEGSRA